MLPYRPMENGLLLTLNMKDLQKFILFLLMEEFLKELPGRD
jgi:hypothetical protein